MLSIFSEGVIALLRSIDPVKSEPSHGLTTLHNADYCLQCREDAFPLSTELHALNDRTGERKMQRIEDAQQLDRIFHALADQSRRGMLDRLSKGPASVSELAEPLELALPSVVKHLAVLEQGGIVISRKEGRVRTYALAPTAFDAIEAWVARRKRGLDRQFDRLEQFLAKGAGPSGEGK